jgi:hypothetical protein
MADLRRIRLGLDPAGLRALSLSPCSDSGTQPGGVPSAPTGPLGPPGHGQTLGKSEGIRAGQALGREWVGLSGWVEGVQVQGYIRPAPQAPPSSSCPPCPLSSCTPSPTRSLIRPWWQLLPPRPQVMTWMGGLGGGA